MFVELPCKRQPSFSFRSFHEGPVYFLIRSDDHQRNGGGTVETREGFRRGNSRERLDAIGRLVADEWIIVGLDGAIVGRARFFDVIRSALSNARIDGIRRFSDARLRRQRHGHRADPHERQIHGRRVRHAGTGYRCLCEARRAVAMRVDAPDPFVE